MTTPQTEFSAQMSLAGDGSNWALYVVVFGSTGWPKILIPPTHGIPTLATRAAALRDLGYVPISEDPYWDWLEIQDIDDLAEPVHLLAVLTVVRAQEY